MIRRILDTLAVVAFVAFLPLLAVAQSGVSAISSAGGAAPGQGSSTTCGVASAVWRTSTPAATLDCSAGLTYDGTTFAVTGAATISGSVGIGGTTEAGTALTVTGDYIGRSGGRLWLRPPSNSAASSIRNTGGNNMTISAGGLDVITVTDNTGATTIGGSVGAAAVAATITDSDGQALRAGVPDLNLTDNTIATFAVQTLGDDTGGGGSIWYTVCARDATTFGCESGVIDFVGGDATSGAGGEVCTNPVKHGTPPQALSGSTLTVTFAATTGTDLCNLRVTADTDIVTPTSLTIKWGVLNSGRTITPQ